MGFYERRILPWLLDMAMSAKPITHQRRKVVPLAEGRVLEIGMGAGQNLAFYDPARVSHIWGLEPSAEMRERARKRAKDLSIGLDFLDLKAEEIPLDDKAADTVLVTYTLCTIPEVVRALKGMRRVLKPGGRLIVNTPHARNTALRRLRLRLGQTDEKHGHVRPGYTRESLGALLREDFVIDESSTYTKAFSETVDTAMQWALESLGKKGSKKGVVVTGGDLNRHAKLFKVYSLVFPFVWGFSRLDALLPANDGYRLLLSATRKNA